MFECRHCGTPYVIDRVCSCTEPPDYATLDRSCGHRLDRYQRQLENRSLWVLCVVAPPCCWLGFVVVRFAVNAVMG